MHSYRRNYKSARLGKAAGLSEPLRKANAGASEVFMRHLERPVSKASVVAMIRTLHCSKRCECRQERLKPLTKESHIHTVDVGEHTPYHNNRHDCPLISSLPRRCLGSGSCSSTSLAILSIQCMEYIAHLVRLLDELVEHTSSRKSRWPDLVSEEVRSAHGCKSSTFGTCMWNRKKAWEERSLEHV